MAQADKITGPYTHLTYVPGGTCDMTLFGDSDGKVYAIKPRGDVFMQQIDLTNLEHDQVKWVGPETRAVTASNADIGVKTSPAYLEGPWLEKIGQRFFLFYAALYKDDSDPALRGYQTGVAYADSIAGPWKKDCAERYSSADTWPSLKVPMDENGFHIAVKKTARTAACSASTRSTLMLMAACNPMKRWKAQTPGRRRGVRGMAHS